MFSPPSCRMIQGRGCAYWTMMSSTIEPMRTAAAASAEATSSGMSTGARLVASSAFSTGRGKPSAAAIASRSRGQPVPLRTVAPIAHMLKRVWHSERRSRTRRSEAAMPRR